MPSEATIRPLGRPGDLGWVVMAHGELYTREYDWDVTFEAMVAAVMADYAAGLTSESAHRQAAWIAELDGRRVGCIACVPSDEKTAQLRVLLLDPATRGLGLGRRLVRECLEFAADVGYDAIRLWTVDILDAARRLYQDAGFVLAEQERFHRFGHDVVAQTWELSLPHPQDRTVRRG